MAKNTTQTNEQVNDETTKNTQQQETGGGTKDETQGADAGDGFEWVAEEDVKKPATKYDWAAFPAPREVDGKMRFASKKYEGVGSKTLYGSYSAYVSKIEAENEKITKENAEIAAANAKLEEGDPARKPQKELKLVPEFTNSEHKDKPGKAGKVLYVTVTRIK